MPSFEYTRGEERTLFDSSFEPDGDGFLFYRTHWSRGVPVTAAEREAYLSVAFPGSRRDFYAAIRGRAPAGPRRSYWRSNFTMLAAMPASFGVGFLAFGAMFLTRGLGGGDGPALTWLLLAAGGLGVGIGAEIVLVRLWLEWRREKE